MENIPNWVWLAGKIILTVLAVAGGLNAILSLKSRWKDWWAPKSKLGFEKRLRQLSLLIAEVSKLKNNPHLYSIAVGDNLLNAVLTFLLTLLFVMIATLFYLLTGDVTVVKWIALFTVVIIGIVLLVSLDDISKTAKLSRYVRDPEILLKEITKLIERGNKNGYQSDNQEKILEDFQASGLMPDDEQLHYPVDKLKSNATTPLK